MDYVSQGKYCTKIVVLIVCCIFLFYANLLIKFLESSTERSKPSCADVTGKGRLINELLMDYDIDVRSRFDDLVARNVSSRDPALISLVREIMDPPSGHIIKMSRPLAKTPQATAVLEALKYKRNGFFIEAGGLDGERSSNTIYLEQKLGWTGLLVEMDPYFYTQLRGKNRRSWSINACIGPSDRPIKMDFKESSGGQGKLLPSVEAESRSVPCFPLESMLLALNTTHVDYFSLDVEGYELEVLRTIPFDRIDISALSVEYAHGSNGKASYTKFMERQGFITYKDIKYVDTKITLFVADFIFVNKNVGSYITS